MISTQKRCTIGSLICVYPKNGQIWPKTGLFGSFDSMPDQKTMQTSCQGGFPLSGKWHFWPNIGIFGPFDPMPDQKTMRTSCLGFFYVIWVPKLLLNPIKIRLFGPKMAKFGHRYAFLVILAKYWHFLPISSHAWLKINANKVPRWFYAMRVPKLSYSCKN